jgi:hypothetical protein
MQVKTVRRTNEMMIMMLKAKLECKAHEYHRRFVSLINR